MAAVLNPDIYYDLIQETVELKNKDPEFLSKVMFSGKNLLVILKSFMKNIKCITFVRPKRNITNGILQYLIKFHWVRIRINIIFVIIKYRTMISRFGLI